MLARIAGADKTSPYDIRARDVRGNFGCSNDEVSWRKFLYNGFLENSAAKSVSGSALWDRLSSAAKAMAVSKDNLEVVFYRDYKVDDGRYSNNGWMQELPDPVTKLVWDNTVLMSPQNG